MEIGIDSVRFMSDSSSMLFIGYQITTRHNGATALVFNSQGKRLAAIEAGCRLHAENEVKSRYPTASVIYERKGRVYFTGDKFAPSFQSVQWSKMICREN